MFGFVYWPSLRRPSTKVHVLATVLKGWVLYSWYTLVPEVFLDFAPHERGLRESREAVSTSRDAKRKKDISHISRLVFGASREEEKSRKTSGTRVLVASSGLLFICGIRVNLFGSVFYRDVWLPLRSVRYVLEKEKKLYFSNFSNHKLGWGEREGVVRV